MLTNGLAIRRESDRNKANTKRNQKFNLLRMGIVYGCNSVSPVFAQFRVLNARNRSRAPDAFDLDQYLQDEYAYLEYPKHAQSYKDPAEEVIVFHSGTQVLSYDFGTLNPLNKLVSVLIVDDFSEVLKWHGNLVVLSVVAGKVKNFDQSEEELKRVDVVVHRFVICHEHHLTMGDFFLTATSVNSSEDAMVDWPYIKQDQANKGKLQPMIIIKK
ncbi:hypothetical protein EV421DRAFT_1738368 [Armillaria borealis]|uniref:Uncharacterized protein n=1 Tax=Armillaria borealis TaxID=47425 RepID=A0AA39JAY1_9AGAR|nr:hypothetical protein EV421DRAFT_1738368 [Armillaria borealis]